MKQFSFFKILLIEIFVLTAYIVNSQEVGCLYELVNPINKYNYKELNNFPPYNTYNCYNTSFDMGFVLKRTSKSNRSEVTFNLNREYSQLSFVLNSLYIDKGNNIVNSIFIIGDKKVIKEIRLDIYYGPIPFFINIDNINELTIKFDDFTNNNLQILFLDPKLYKSSHYNKFEPENIVHDSVVLIEELKPISYQTNFNIISPANNKFSSGIDYINIEGNRYYSGLLYHAIGRKINYRTKEMLCSFDLKHNYKYLKFIAGPLSTISSRGRSKFLVLGDNNVICSHEFKGGDRCLPFSINISGYRYITFILDSLIYIPDFAITDIKVFSQENIDGINSNIKENNELSWTDIITNIKLSSFYSIDSRERLFYDGTDNNRKILLNGKKYNKGFILCRGDERYIIDTWSNHEENIGYSYASFLLNNKYDSISFTIGWIQNCLSICKDTLAIYADNILVKELLLQPFMDNEYIIGIPDCYQLSFVLRGNDLNPQAAYGIVDLFAHKKEENTLSSKLYYKQSYKEETNDLPYFYITNKAPSKLNRTIYYTMSDVQYMLLNNGDTIYHGVELHPNKWINNKLKIDSKFSSSYLANSLYSPILIHYNYQDSLNDSNYHSCVQYDRDGNIYSHAYACYNLDNKYDSIQFSIGVSIGNNFGKYDYTDLESTIYKQLYIICDDVFTQEIDINNKMTPKVITLPIPKCDKLIFWLPCTNQNTYPYIIYNMKYLKAR